MDVKGATWRTVVALATAFGVATLIVAASAPVWAQPSGGGVRPVPGALVEAFTPPDGPYAAGFRGAALAARPGQPVRAALGGQVSWSGAMPSPGGGPGRSYVVVDHGGGLRTTYADLDPRAVTGGQQVGAGTRLGDLAAEAPRFEWFARLGDDYIDPMSLLEPWRPVLVPTR